MIRFFFLIAFRNLIKNKTTAILNISGLAIGVAVCLFIGIWLQRELSFDDFHPNRKAIFRLATFGAHLTEEIGAVKATSRVTE